MKNDYFEHKADKYEQDNNRTNNVGNIATTVLSNVNFDKNMESMVSLPLRNDLSPSVSGGLGDAGKFGSDDQGWFPVDADYNFPINSPGIPAINTERSLNNIKRKGMEELKKNEGEIKKKATNLLKGLFGK